MDIESLNIDFTVCKVNDLSKVNFDSDFIFVGKTDNELSVVCPTADLPTNAACREDGWRAFRIVGTLDFSLVGVIAKISSLLSESGIPVFVVSTYNTDYVLVKKENEARTIEVLSGAGYRICVFRNN